MLVRMLLCADGAQWADDRIASLQVHSTLAGLTDDDVALHDAKLGTIASFVALASNGLRFSKVVALKGLPIPGSVRVWWTLRRRSKSENQTNAGLLSNRYLVPKHCPRRNRANDSMDLADKAVRL